MWRGRCDPFGFEGMGGVCLVRRATGNCISNWSTGSILSIYAGHGARTQWAGESMWDNADINTLGPTGNLTFNLSLVVWLMRSFYDAIPRSLEEAAWIDGATLWQGFTQIILPMSGPGLAATAILCFLYSWNDFFFALILTRTEATTAPVAVVNFLNYEGWEWGKIAAGGTMVMLPVLVFSIVVRRFLISGMTAGAVKG